MALNDRVNSDNKIEFDDSEVDINKFEIQKEMIMYKIHDIYEF